ncbi:dihydrofolate reductase [Amphibacillus marinus]|uniref:Dihydrofolate reductase n=1 Tax=Amphibacillus marinus TaxID=872970 RepID=A0A1H8GKY7_9BACI|nr:dihydrofolate reductase [Amphibacillus marinus]SEN44801.1 dihydrofolate reductase [Amphibacillus marinus]
MITMIAAHDQNRLIGKGDWMPWHIPNDLGYFKAKTLGKTIVMGRKTLETFGKPLPKRENIILTRDHSYQIDDCKVFHDFETLLTLLQNDNQEVFIIGGGEIYELFLPYANRLYITQIENTFEGDTYFPAYDLTNWKLISKEKGLKNEDNPYDYYFLQYDRVK